MDIDIFLNYWTLAALTIIIAAWAILDARRDRKLQAIESLRCYSDDSHYH